MPVIEISEGAYAILQAAARPFEDTPATALDRILGVTPPVPEIEPSSCKVSPLEKRGELHRFNWGCGDFFTHARVTRAVVNGSGMKNPSWNGLMAHLLNLGAGRGWDSALLERATRLRWRENGKLVPFLGRKFGRMSVVDLLPRLRAILSRLDLNVAIEVLWGSKAPAARRGKVERYLLP